MVNREPKHNKSIFLTNNILFYLGCNPRSNSWFGRYPFWWWPPLLSTHFETLQQRCSCCYQIWEDHLRDDDLLAAWSCPSRERRPHVYTTKGSADFTWRKMKHEHFCLSGQGAWLEIRYGKPCVGSNPTECETFSVFASKNQTKPTNEDRGSNNTPHDHTTPPFKPLHQLNTNTLFSTDLHSDSQTLLHHSNNTTNRTATTTISQQWRWYDLMDSTTSSSNLSIYNNNDHTNNNNSSTWWWFFHIFNNNDNTINNNNNINQSTTTTGTILTTATRLLLPHLSLSHQ